MLPFCCQGLNKFVWKPHKYWGSKVQYITRTRKVGFDFNSSLVIFYTFIFSILQIFLLLYFVSELFSTNPVPAQLFVIVCSSGGLQVFGITQ
jgi:hypothetical protein